MRRLIHTFDGWLRKSEGVFEFTQAPDCILRLRRSRARDTIRLADAVIPAGAPTLEIHLWNERIPPIPATGANMAWAGWMTRRFIGSFRLVADYMLADPTFESIRAVCGITVLADASADSSGGKILTRLGFALLPYHNHMGRFGEFWENFYTWWLMWAYNAVSVRRRSLLGMRRIEFWMEAEAFRRRHAPHVVLQRPG
jgi:hypothetical protein